MSTGACRASPQFLLDPTVKQKQALDRLVAEQRRLYNAALEERRGAWRWERRSVTRYEQYRTLTGLTAQEPALHRSADVNAAVNILRAGQAQRLEREANREVA